MSQNIIPQLYAAGSFEANAPFDSVVNPGTFYTVEAIQTPSELQGLKTDLFKVIWEPAGVTKENYQNQLAELIAVKGAVIVLTAKNKQPVYVPSTYIKSFPLVDGVIYERVCIITDCGSVPPAFKDVLNSAIDHFNNYMKDNYGLENPNTVLGTISSRGYVTKEQAAAWELTRQNAIKDNPSDLIRLETALKVNAQQAAYITELEQALIDAGK